MRSSHVVAAAGMALVVMLTTAGCGLKGPLALPEKSERVIIRGPGETAGPATGPAAGEAATGETATGGGATGPTATGETATGGGANGSSAAEAPADKKTPREERPPPPPLPGGSNPGTARGG